MRLQVPVHGIRVGDQPTDLPAAKAAEPVSICETDSRDPSKFRVKLTPDTWAPPCEDRLMGTITVSPGLPELFPIEITASADWAAAPPTSANSRTTEIRVAVMRFFIALVWPMPGDRANSISADLISNYY